MTTPEALFGVVPFGRVDFGWARLCKAVLGGARAGLGIWRGEAGPGEAWRGKAWLGIWRGVARQRGAWLGWAGQGMECGSARRGRAGRGVAKQGTSKARNMARRGTAWPGAARLGKAWNKGGHIRKNNKPTQPNGTNTQQRTHEPRRRSLCGVPKRGQRASSRDEYHKLAGLCMRPTQQGVGRLLDRGGEGRREDGERCAG